MLKETQSVVVAAAGHSKPGLPDGHAHWNIGGRQPHYFGLGLNYLYKVGPPLTVGDIQQPNPHDRLCSSKVSGWLPEKLQKKSHKYCNFSVKLTHLFTKFDT